MKRRWKFALLLLVPLALYFYIAERNSWRPKTIVTGSSEVDFVKYSPDGRYLVVLAGMVGDQSLLLYDAQSRSVIYKIKDVSEPLFFLDAEHLAVQGSYGKASAPDGTVCDDRLNIYSVPEGKLLETAPQLLEFFGALDDGKTLLGWYDPYNRKLIRWNWHWVSPLEPALSEKSIEKASPLWNADILADGKTLWLRAQKSSSNLEFWDLNSQKLRFKVKLSIGDGFCMSSTRNGLCALSRANADGDKIEIWNYKTGKRQRSFSALPRLEVTLSPDGTLLVACDGQNPTIYLQDIKTGKVVRRIPRQASPSSTYALDFSPDGRTLASGSDDGTVKLWRIK